MIKKRDLCGIYVNSCVEIFMIIMTKQVESVIFFVDPTLSTSLPYSRGKFFDKMGISFNSFNSRGTTHCQ